MVIERQKTKIDELDRIAHPERYRLSSGAELVHHFIPNYDNPSIHIWTRVGNEEYDTRTYIDYFSDIWTRFRKGESTIHELINDVLEPQEQVNEAQAQLLVQHSFLRWVDLVRLMSVLVAEAQILICLGVRGKRMEEKVGKMGFIFVFLSIIDSKIDCFIIFFVQRLLIFQFNNVLCIKNTNFAYNSTMFNL